MLGITPAYAGKSLSVSPARTVLRDHPRLCGEKDSLKIKQLSGVGSPPPMRGKDFTAKSIHVYKGITPAYAGKSVDTLNELRDS